MGRLFYQSRERQAQLVVDRYTTQFCVVGAWFITDQSGRGCCWISSHCLQPSTH